MPMIEFEWTLNLPNDYLVDHSQSEGKTRTAVYDGPDKIYLIVDNETGKEAFGPITEREKNDGRPIPLGCRYVEVDCTENPLVCQLRGPVVDEQEEEYEDEEFHPQSPDIPGYPRLTRQYPLMARDIYDGTDLTIDENDNITVPIKSVAHSFYSDDREFPTWDQIKKRRNQMLADSDGILSDDMPESLQQEWRTYRQRLRDMPTALASVPTHIADQMYPQPPGSDIPPENG